MPAVVYCRVSSKEQIQGTSLSSQQEACLEYAAKHSIVVARIFVEMGESAKFSDRTELLKLIQFCSEKKNSIDVLIVWKVDRFARNVADHFQIKAILNKHGVVIHSVTEPIDSKPEGRLMETMLAGFAQFDNDIRALRSVGGMRRKIQDGICPWKPPLGYLLRSHTGTKKAEPDIPDPDRFGIVQEAWKKILAGVCRKADVVRFFEAHGLRTRKGDSLSPQFVDKLFANPYYAGILVDPWTNERHEGRHIAMVTPQEFERVQQIFNRQHRKLFHQRAREDFPLRAVLRCQFCKQYLTSSWSRGRSGRYPYYRCYNRSCAVYAKSFTKASVESRFAQYLSQLVPAVNAISALADQIQAALSGQVERNRESVARQEDEAGKIEKQIREAIDLRTRQLITDEQFTRVHKELTEKAASIRENLPQLRAEEVPSIDVIREVLQFLAHLPELWSRLPLEFWQRFQRILFPDGTTMSDVGTAENRPLLWFIGHCTDANTTEVALSCIGWNRMADQLNKLYEAVRESRRNSVEDGADEKSVSRVAA